MALKDLKEKRARNVTEMRAIHDKAETEKRGLTDDEQARFDALEAEARSIGDQIRRGEAIAEMERQADACTIDGTPDFDREMRAFSIANAIAAQMPNSGVDAGREIEISQEITRRNGKAPKGIMIPTELVLGHEERAITTTTGADLIQTDVRNPVDRFRPALRTERMGATVLRNLSGDLDLPKLVSSGSAHWIVEHTDTTRSDVSFDKVSLGPKTVSGEYELSRRMKLQSGTAIEDILRRDLGFVLAQALDAAAIRGGGTNEPTGILANAGVTATTGGALDSDITAEMIAALDIDDVMGSRAFLTNPNVAKAARKTKDTEGHVIPMSEIFHGERVEVTTQCPADIGTSSDKNALIYGQWSELIIGYWSGIDILANPYHSDVASKGGLLIHAFLDADVVVRHTEAFTFAEID